MSLCLVPEGLREAVGLGFGIAEQRLCVVALDIQPLGGEGVEPRVGQQLADGQQISGSVVGERGIIIFTMPPRVVT